MRTSVCVCGACVVIATKTHSRRENDKNVHQFEISSVWYSQTCTTHNNLPHSGPRLTCVRRLPMKGHTDAGIVACRATIMYYVVPITAEGSTRAQTHTKRGDFGGNDVHTRLYCRTRYARVHTHTRTRRHGERVFPFIVEWEGKMHVCRVYLFGGRRLMLKTRRYKLFLVDGFCFRPADSQMSIEAMWWGCQRPRRTFYKCICAIHEQRDSNSAKQ